MLRRNCSIQGSSLLSNLLSSFLFPALFFALNLEHLLHDFFLEIPVLFKQLIQVKCLAESSHGFGHFFFGLTAFDIFLGADYDILFQELFFVFLTCSIASVPIIKDPDSALLLYFNAEKSFVFLLTRIVFHLSIIG